MTVRWAQRQAVREMSASGMSARGITRATGLARGTVRRILSGVAPARCYDGEADNAVRKGCYERCPACGAKARMPCLACIVRTARRVGTVAVVQSIQHAY
jgi:hypothetical protein